MKEIYKIKPVYQQTVWGGNTIREYYHIESDLENIGQVYHVIGIENHLDNEVEGTGETLSSFYKTHSDLFDCNCPYFPIRLATSSSIGLQSYHLHPNNEYAIENEGTLGKVSGNIAYNPTGEKSLRFYGTTAQNLDEFEKMIEEEKWDEMRKFIEVSDEQFFHTPAGLIHGGGGSDKMSIVFATNSDLSYRLYDYGRNDPSRKLHIKQVLDCITFDHDVKGIDPVINELNGLKVTIYYEKEKEYCAYRVDVEEEGFIDINEFVFIECAEGNGQIGNTEIKLGETVFIPAHYGRLMIKGKMRLYMISYKD